MSLNRSCLGRTYGPSTYEVTSQAIAQYAAATLDPNPAYQTGESGSTPMLAPPAMAFLPCWPVISEALSDPDLGNEPGQVIHGEQVMRFARPLVAGDVVTTTGTVTKIETKGRNEVYVLALESRDQSGTLVVSQDNICISLGSALADEVETAAPATRAPRPARPAAGEPDLVAECSIPLDITKNYAEASGDCNRVHLEAEFAKTLGFPGVIVHGMCLLSIALQGVVNNLPAGQESSIKELRVRFSSPAEPGERVETRYFQSTGSTDFEMFGSDGRRTLAGGNVSMSSTSSAD